MICALCGKPAAGNAGLANSSGFRAYCHGDDDAEPTCYQTAMWKEFSSGSSDFLLALRDE